MKNKPTLLDVARIAGCSKSTVSFVLNNKKGISANTRERVLTACKELKYGEMEIYSEKSPITLCLLDIILDSNISQYRLFEVKSFYLRGIQTRCQELNINLETITLYELDKEKLKESLDSIPDLSGVIVFGSDLQKEAEFLLFKDLSLPFVFIDSYYPSQEYNFINVDNYSGTFKLLKYLSDLNHKDIGLLSIDSINFNIQERKKAFQQSLHISGLHSNENWVFEYSLQNDEMLDAYIKGLIDSNNLPTVFICTTDLISVQLLPILAKYHISAPRDLSIVSFGDLNISQITSPQITTIDPPKNQIGRAAVQLIVNRLDKKSIPDALGYTLNSERVLISYNLLIRDSACEI